MTRTRSNSKSNRHTKRSGTKRSGTKRSGTKRSGAKHVDAMRNHKKRSGGVLTAPEHKPLPRDKINIYLDTLAIKAPNPWRPPPPPHPTDIADPRRMSRQSALMSTVIVPVKDGDDKIIQSGHVKFLTDRLLAPASAAQDSPEQLLAQNSQKQQNDLVRYKLSKAHASSTDTLNLSKITDLKKQIFNLLFSTNPIDCGRQLTNLDDVPFLIDVIVDKLKNMQTICSDMGPKCPLLSHYPDKYKDIFNALLRCRQIHRASDLRFISDLKGTIVPPSTEPEALRTRFRFSPERIEVLIHYFNGLKSVILTCLGGGLNPPLRSANPSLYAFLTNETMRIPTLSQDLDKDEIREFKEFIRVNTLIKTMPMSEIDAYLRTKYIKKIRDMIEAVHSGEMMEIRLIEALGASQPDPDPSPDCDELMAGLAGLMPRIAETLSSRVANLGEVVEFW